MGAEERGDPLFAKQKVAHGVADIDHDPGSDLQVGAPLKREDARGLPAVVEQAEVGELEVIDWETILVDCAEGEVDFVDADGKGVRSCGVGLRGGVWLRGLRGGEDGVKEQENEPRGSQSHGGTVQGRYGFVMH